MSRRKEKDRIDVAREWFETEVEYGKKVLGLTDWDITVEANRQHKVDSAYCEAATDIHDGHLTATIVFREDVLKGEARYNVYHELGHLLFRNWSNANQEIIDDMVPTALTDKVNEVLSKGEEDAVERFAHAIVRLLPAERTEPNGTPAS